MKRIIMILLAVIMTLTVFLTGCADDGQKQETSDVVSGNESGEPTDSVSDVEYEPDTIPSSLKFTDEEVYILAWKATNIINLEEFEAAENSSELLDNAVYSRNLAVEERLGVHLNYIRQDGGYFEIEQFVKTVESSVNDDTSYDIIASHTAAGGTLAVRGLITDLNTVEHLNFSKPWWPSSLTAEASINDQLYFASGDISANYLYMMQGIIINEDYAETLQIGDEVYSLAENGDWTLDKLISYSERAYINSDGDSAKSESDSFGFAIYTEPLLDSFYQGFGFKILDNSGEELKLSSSVTSLKIIEARDKLRDFLYESNCSYCEDGEKTIKPEQVTNAISTGSVLFMLEYVGYLSRDYQEYDWKYGVLPVPKYDDNQKDYITVVGESFSLFSIPENAYNHSMSGAVMECMASEGYRKVTPAVFEIAFKLKYSKNEQTSKMFDILRNTISMDAGRFFVNQFKTSMIFIYRYSIKYDYPYRSYFTQYNNMLTSSIKEINDILS